MGQCQTAMNQAGGKNGKEKEIKVSGLDDIVAGNHLENNYKLKKILGQGAFSTVREGVHKQTNHAYAVKCVKKQSLSKADEDALMDEVNILKLMKHRNIITLHEFYDEKHFYYLVLENMTGGELFDRIVERQYYNEKDARDLIIVLLHAMKYCHDNSIAHRDLKPENLLLVSKDSDADIKIADFGFAKRVSAPKTLTTQCGTPGYVAPEILSGVPYDQSADMWSVGVIMYILLGGYPPFSSDNQAELFKMIKKGSFEFHPEFWKSVSNDAKDLIKSLLTVDPNKRITASQCLDNKWICGDSSVLSQRDLSTNLEEFKRFNAKRKFKSAVKGVMAANRMKNLIASMKEGAASQNA